MGWRNLTKAKKIVISKSRVKTMLVIFLDWQGEIHKEFVLEGEAVCSCFFMFCWPLITKININAVYYKMCNGKAPKQNLTC